MPIEPRIGIIVYGAFADETSKTTNFLRMQVQLLHTKNANELNNSSIYAENDVDIFELPIVANVDDIDRTRQVERSHTFYLSPSFFEQIAQNDTILQLRIKTIGVDIGFPIILAYDPTPIDKAMGVFFAAIILLFLYVMIITEIVDRIFAAIVASTLSIAVLAYMNERPTMPEILSWIDIETLLLLFGMMTLVAILSETGLFDFLAVFAFKVRFLFQTNSSSNIYTSEFVFFFSKKKTDNKRQRLAAYKLFMFVYCFVIGISG